MASIHNHLLPRALWEGTDLATLHRDSSIPMATLIRHSVGDRFLDLIMANTKRSTKIALGQETGITSAGPNLWTSPSEQLQGNSKLTRRHKNHIITHKTILKYGEEVVQRFEQERERNLKEIAHEQTFKLREEMKRQAKMEAAHAKTLQQQEYMQRLANIRAQLQKDHENQITSLKCQLKQESEARINEMMKMVKESMNDSSIIILQQAEENLKLGFNFRLKWAVAEIYEDYMEKYLQQMKLLTVTHRLEMERLLHQKSKKTEVHSKDTSKQQSNERDPLEKLNKIVLQVQTGAKRKRDVIKRKLKSTKLKLSAVKESNKKLKNTNKSSKLLIKEVLHCYQKFIDYHLKTTPGEMKDFLLSPQICLDRLRNREKSLKQTAKQINEADCGSSINRKKSNSSQHKSEGGDKKDNKSIVSCDKEVESLINNIIKKVVPSDTKALKTPIKIIKEPRKCLHPVNTSENEKCDLN